MWVILSRKEALSHEAYKSGASKSLSRRGGRALILLPAFSVGPTFIPDSTFKGSTLAAWHPLGDAEWRAGNGETIRTPKSTSGGWLLMDKPLQDSGFYVRI